MFDETCRVLSVRSDALLVINSCNQLDDETDARVACFFISYFFFIFFFFFRKLASIKHDFRR